MPSAPLRSAPFRRPPRRLQPVLSGLEERLLLNAGGPELPSDLTPAMLPGVTMPLYPWPANSLAAPSVSYAVTGTTYPLTAVPALNSLPGATVSLYLDFNGDNTPSYGSYSPGVTPAYDQDGDPTSFSAGELASIQSIWSYVAEDYAPFNINVTTVQPSSMAHGVTQKVVIGGDGAWTGGLAGGLSYINAFTSTGVPNISYVFSKNLAGGNPRYTGDAASHEAGHGFGLQHQSKWSGTTLVQEYWTGPGDGTAPLMGGSYAAQRSVWWYGTTGVSSTSYQDDMAVIAGAQNGFGYRARTATTLATAPALAAQGGTQLSASGLLVKTTDVDYYSFSSGAGAVSFTVTPPASVANLAPKVSILDASGNVIATAGPGQNLSATVTATLPAGGSYRIAVASNGGFGNVGHYSLSGTVIAWANPGGGGGTNPGTGGTGTGSGSGGTTGTGSIALAAPTGVKAVAVSSYRIDLSWNGVAGAAGYLMEYSLDGVNWLTLGGTTAAVTTFSDLYVAPGTTRAYRVIAVGQGVTSVASAVAVATSPPIPSPPSLVSSLYMVARSPRQVSLAWQPSTGTVQGYVIERSSNGKSWTAVARLYGTATAFTDTSVAPGKSYFYRVRSFNNWGSTSPSPVVRVMTPRAASVPFLRRK